MSQTQGLRYQTPSDDGVGKVASELLEFQHIREMCHQLIYGAEMAIA